ncbi:hypothetical protein FIBSPDRAFT_1040519 [Athelia psychrophila]|uniref:Uncharacterized protein n=1 Tax=Athelia psychrophila TaxID=1759441 RepID=A0A166Q553_9AGAM|nr:hypothetical protein FIBSPDRAFT_1040519 [Fibularhizoctonia sp. CBS 109695]
MALSEETVKQRCREHWNKGFIDLRNICFLSDDEVAKIAWQEVPSDHAWLDFFGRCAVPADVRVPRLRGPPVADQIEDKFGAHPYHYLRMERIYGPTLQQHLDAGGAFDAALADAVVEAYLALRRAFPDTGELRPGGRDHLIEGHLFPYDNEGAWVVATKADLIRVLEELARASDAPAAWDLAAAPCAFAHGDLSPTNIVVTPAGVAFLDFRYARLWPDGYERWTLETSLYDARFTLPMVAAFDREGLVTSAPFAANLSRIKRYYATFGVSLCM